MKPVNHATLCQNFKFKKASILVVASLMPIALFCFSGCGNAYQSLTGKELTSGKEIGSKSNLSSDEQGDVYFSLGRAAEKQGNLQEAIRLYQATLKKKPKSGESHWRMAVCLDKSGNFQKSATHYHEALKLMPGNPDIYCDYGYSLALQKKWSDAEINLKQSLAIQPDLSRAHNNLGLVLAQGSKLDEALRAFQAGGLSAFDAHWNVAQVLISQSRWDEARSEFQLMALINPDDPRVGREIAALNRLVVKLDKVRQATNRDESLVQVSHESQTVKK